MFVVFAGRKSSGKTTLSDILVERGFRKVSFAGRLKRLLTCLYGWEKGVCDTEAGKDAILDQPLKWGRAEAARLCEMIGAERPLNDASVEFSTRREALQHVATRVLRDYDSYFHIKSVREEISEPGNYVLDDCRFPNELQELRGLGARCFFVVRPTWYDYSNDASESTLRRCQFPFVIVNNLTALSFTTGFERLLEQVDRVIAANTNATLVLSPKWASSAHCNHSVFSRPTYLAAFWAGVLSQAGGVRLASSGMEGVYLSSMRSDLISDFVMFMECDHPFIAESIDPLAASSFFTVDIASSFVVDDLKLWSMRSGVRRDGMTVHDIPFMIEGDRDLISIWLAGCADGAAANRRVGIRLRGSMAAMEEARSFFGTGVVRMENDGWSFIATDPVDVKERLTHAMRAKLAGIRQCIG